ncbi:GntR family transcriptional regulator [Propionibacteriaceae bacterium G1746]
MTLRIDPGAAQPPYEQLKSQLVDQMTSGQLPAGTKLPPVRRLAADLGIAPNTVARAYRELEHAGLVVTAGRHGTVVAEHSGLAAGSSGVDDAHTRAARLAADYAAGMQSLGFSHQAAIDELASAWRRV